MLIFYRQVKPDDSQFVAIVICDYTRSDEQYSALQISKAVADNVPTYSGVVVKVIGAPIVYSLDYSAQFSHDGLNYGSALLTHFSADIKGAPSDLVTLMNVKELVSTQNFDALSTSISKVITSQVVFPYFAMVVKDSAGKPIVRKGVVTNATVNTDARRTNMSVSIRGAGYDDAVIRLKFFISIKKGELLFAQIAKQISIKGYTISLPVDIPAKKSTDYPAAPLGHILKQIGLDYNFLSTIDDVKKNISLVSTAPNSPPAPDFVADFSFNNSVSGIPTKLISNFSPNNYASAEFTAEVFDAALFTSIRLFDDSGSTTLFSNFNSTTTVIVVKGTASLSAVSGAVVSRTADTTKTLGDKNAYRFYIQSYTIRDSRMSTTINLVATNNWLLSVVKLDALFEAKVYLQSGL